MYIKNDAKKHAEPSVNSLGKPALPPDYPAVSPYAVMCPLKGRPTVVRIQVAEEDKLADRGKAGQLSTAHEWESSGPNGNIFYLSCPQFI